MDGSGAHDKYPLHLVSWEMQDTRQKPVWLQKHHSTTDHLVSPERYLQDAFAQRQQAVGIFFDLENAYEITWQNGIIRDLHRIGLRGRLPVIVSGYLRDRRIRVRIETILADEFYPEEGVPTGGVLAVTCFGLKINELPSCIARDIFRTLFVDDLAICFRRRSMDTIEIHSKQAMHEWATRNGFKFAAQKCKVLHFTAPVPWFSDPLLLGVVIHLCQWRSPRNSSGFGGSLPSLSRSTSGCWRLNARRPSISSGWLQTWSGVGTETLSWCCTGPLSFPS